MHSEDDDLRQAFAQFDGALVPPLLVSARIQRKVAATQRRRKALATSSVVGVAVIGSVLFLLVANGPSRPTDTLEPASRASGTTSSGISGPIDVQWAWQESVAHYQAKLTNLASSAANYSGIRTDTEEHTITVFGTGSPSTEMANLIAAAPSNATVTWTTAAYSMADLEHAGNSAARLVNVWAVQYVENWSAVQVSYAPQSRNQSPGAMPERVDGVPIVWIARNTPVATPE